MSAREVMDAIAPAHAVDTTIATARRVDDVLHVRVSAANYFDDSSCVELLAVMESLAASSVKGGPSKLLMDLSDIAMAGSHFIGVISAIHRTAKAENRQLALTGVNPQLAMSFKIACVERFVRIFDDVEAAIRKLNR